MENKFFNFFQPYFDFIDSGKFFRTPFKYLYMLLAVVNLLFPLYVLYEALDNKIFDAPGKILFAFFLLWLILLVAGWLSFQLWWNRKDKVEQVSAPADDFVAIPVYSHFIQTFGEYIGSWIACVGTIFGIITVLFEGSDSLRSLLSIFPLGKGGVETIVESLVTGFVIIVGFRVVAELLRGIVSIANNTKR